MKTCAVLALSLVLAAVPAAARETCLRHGVLTAHLAKFYSEQPVSAGLDASGKLFEMFVSPRGTWTLWL